MNRTIGPNKAVIFNVATPIEAMFYTPYVAYEFMPTTEQIDSLQRRGYQVYIFEQPPESGARPTARRVGDTR